MGSTGHASLTSSNAGGGSDLNFGIKGAVSYSGKVPINSGLEPVGSNKVTLKMPINRQDNVIFQFKLSKDNKLMFITAYKNGVPEVRCKVSVDSKSPDLNKLLNSPKASERSAALKMKELISQAPNMDEGKLDPISKKLLADKRKKGE